MYKLEKLSGSLLVTNRFNRRLKPTNTLSNTLAFIPATTSIQLADNPSNFLPDGIIGVSAKYGFAL